MPFKKGHKKTGGKKPGSKHKKTLQQEMALEAIRERYRQEIPDLVERKIDLAKGLKVVRFIIEKNKKGKKTRRRLEYYERDPDSKAIEEIFDRVVGKPKSLWDLGEEFPTTVIINITSEEVAKAKKRIAAKKKI